MLGRVIMDVNGEGHTDYINTVCCGNSADI
jgi:hypothetical protein